MIADVPADAAPHVTEEYGAVDCLPAGHGAAAAVSAVVAGCCVTAADVAVAQNAQSVEQSLKWAIVGKQIQQRAGQHWMACCLSHLLKAKHAVGHHHDAASVPQQLAHQALA